MSFYGDRVPAVLKAETEYALQKSLLELGLATDSKLEIITIYPRGSFIYAWYFIDAKRHGIPNLKEMAQDSKAAEKAKKLKLKEDIIKP
jgi:hypothetical protein